MKRTCLDCQTPIQGRTDKKFCCDSCRNSYNNRQHKEVNNGMRQINRTLGKNRRILAALNPQEKSKTTREILITKGFDFNFFTSMYETRKGSRYYFVYEQGYIFLDRHNLALVRKKEYVDKR